MRMEMIAISNLVAGRSIFADKARVSACDINRFPRLFQRPVALHCLRESIFATQDDFECLVLLHALYIFLEVPTICAFDDN
mmetsp:Transcript_15798/g.31581  ORF Transcript_15798/g.31581 Transcript_15798/m.31581 type:complete len:81 (-) Transcript_15798:126-368(-)